MNADTPDGAGSALRALTLHQPWATLIAIGAKTIETRSWPPPRTVRPGDRLAIHAGKHVADWMNEEWEQRVRALLGSDWRVSVPRGAVVAVATLAAWGVTENRGRPWSAVPGDISGDDLLFGDWSPGRYAWVLTDVEPLDPPEPARGYQGLWNWRRGPG